MKITPGGRFGYSPALRQFCISYKWIAGAVTHIDHRTQLRALHLEMFVDEAETELYNISAKEYGINSLVAEYTLKTWKDQGKLYEHLKKNRF